MEQLDNNARSIICNKARTKHFAGVQDHYIMHLIMLVPSNTL